MNLICHGASGAPIAARYLEEADKARWIEPAPRRSVPVLLVFARGLRNLAQRLSRFAERLEPAPARDGATGHGQPHPTPTN